MARSHKVIFLHRGSGFPITRPPAAGHTGLMHMNSHGTGIQKGLTALESMVTL